MTDEPRRDDEEYTDQTEYVEFDEEVSIEIDSERDEDTDDDVPFRLPKVEDIVEGKIIDDDETDDMPPVQEADIAAGRDRHEMPTMPIPREPGTRDPRQTLDGSGGMDPQPGFRCWEHTAAPVLSKSGHDGQHAPCQHRAASKSTAISAARRANARTAFPCQSANGVATTPPTTTLAARLPDDCCWRFRHFLWRSDAAHAGGQRRIWRTDRRRIEPAGRPGGPVREFREHVLL